MLGELNRNRYRALELLADHVRMPSRELSLDAIIVKLVIKVFDGLQKKFIIIYLSF